MEDAYATCDGDIKAAIVEFGMNLDDNLFNRKSSTRVVQGVEHLWTTKTVKLSTKDPFDLTLDLFPFLVLSPNVLNTSYASNAPNTPNTSYTSSNTSNTSHAIHSTARPGFTKQAFNLTGQEWMDKTSQEYKEESNTESKLSDESKTDSNAEATSEENKTMDNGEDYSTTPTQSIVFDQLIVFVTCAYAHPIQYGEDIRLSAARGENKRLEELLRRGCNPMATDGMGWT